MQSLRRRLVAGTALAAAVVVSSSACTEAAPGPTDIAWGSSTAPVSVTVDDAPTSSTAPSSPASSPAPTNAPADVLAALESLPVKGRAPKTGYDRDLFGSSWTDDVDVDGGHNGCDTRNDILQRDLTSITFKPRTRDCVVAAGVLNDVYTGKTIDFTRGNRTSSAVQIDHVVALADAWQKGAQQLTEEQRTDLANDPLNLQAVDGPTNQRKSASDAATWLPPSKAYRCTYVSRQIEVKARYHLWVTAAERDAMKRELGRC